MIPQELIAKAVVHAIVMLKQQVLTLIASAMDVVRATPTPQVQIATVYRIARATLAAPVTAI